MEPWVVDDHDPESREPAKGFVESATVLVFEEGPDEVVLVAALAVVESRPAGLAAVTV